MNTADNDSIADEEEQLSTLEYYSEDEIQVNHNPESHSSYFHPLPELLGHYPDVSGDVEELCFKVDQRTGTRSLGDGVVPTHRYRQAIKTSANPARTDSHPDFDRNTKPSSPSNNPRDTFFQLQQPNPSKPKQRALPVELFARSLANTSYLPFGYNEEEVSNDMFLKIIANSFQKKDAILPYYSDSSSSVIQEPNPRGKYTSPFPINRPMSSIQRFVAEDSSSLFQPVGNVDHHHHRHREDMISQQNTGHTATRTQGPTATRTQGPTISIQLFKTNPEDDNSMLGQIPNSFLNHTPQPITNNIHSDAPPDNYGLPTMSQYCSSPLKPQTLTELPKTPAPYIHSTPVPVETSIPPQFRTNSVSFAEQSPPTNNGQMSNVEFGEIPKLISPIPMENRLTVNPPSPSFSSSPRPQIQDVRDTPRENDNMITFVNDQSTSPYITAYQSTPLENRIGLDSDPIKTKYFQSNTPSQLPDQQPNSSDIRDTPINQSSMMSPSWMCANSSEGCKPTTSGMVSQLTPDPPNHDANSINSQLVDLANPSSPNLNSSIGNYGSTDFASNQQMSNGQPLNSESNLGSNFLQTTDDPGELFRSSANNSPSPSKILSDN